jgi:hypothetical protein
MSHPMSITLFLNLCWDKNQCREVMRIIHIHFAWAHLQIKHLHFPHQTFTSATTNTRRTSSPSQNCRHLDSFSF